MTMESLNKPQGFASSSVFTKVFHKIEIERTIGINMYMDVGVQINIHIFSPLRGLIAEQDLIPRSWFLLGEVTYFKAKQERTR